MEWLIFLCNTTVLLLFLFLASAPTLISAQCGVGSYRNSSTNQCTLCQGNSYCPEAGYCVDGCPPCPVSTSANANRSNCVSAVCVVCPVGFVCKGTNDIEACTPGTFNGLTGQGQPSACLPCQRGAFGGAFNMSACVACAPGTYAPFTGATACLNCSAGAYQFAGGASACILCPPGTYAGMQTRGAAYALACFSCQAGSYSTARGATVCALCPVGTYGPNTRQATDNNSCTAVVEEEAVLAFDASSGALRCAPGTTCASVLEANSIGMLPWRTTWNFPDNASRWVWNRADVISNPQGPLSRELYFTRGVYIGACHPCLLARANNMSVLIYAAADTRCSVRINNATAFLVTSPNNVSAIDGWSSTPQPVFQGTLLPGYNTLEAFVQNRDGGVGGLLLTVVCRVPSSSQLLPIARSDDTWSVSNASLYTPSVPAFVLSRTAVGCAPCAAGTFNTGVGMIAPTPNNCSACLPGSYQPLAGSYQCVQCSNNTYLNATGATRASDCQPCPVATETLADGAASLRQCVCSRGNAGRPGGPCAACGAGTYAAGTNNSACTLCPADTYDADPLTVYTRYNVDQVCSPVPANAYTARLGATAFLCNAGYFVDKTQPIGDLCSPCPYHTYFNQANATACLPCTNGRTSGLATTSARGCVCNAGFYLPAVGVPVIVGSECLPCPVGAFYCPGGGGIPPQACPPFSNTTSAVGAASSISDCVCIPGYYTRGAAAGGTCQICDAGFYCPGGANASMLACPSNSSAPLPGRALSECVCLPGYRPHNNLSSGTAGVPCVLCPVGVFCLSGTASACPANSIAASGSTNISNCRCNQGFFASYSAAMTAMTCNSCPVNAFCLGGTSPFTPCPSNSSTGGSVQRFAIDHCICNSGFVSASTSACALCPPGFYCFATTQIQCSNNAFSLPGSGTVGACVCNAGYYGTNSLCTACPAGTFMPTTNFTGSRCISCPSGTYSTTVAAVLSSGNCLPCAAGTYASSAVSLAPTGCTLCLPGTYSSARGANLSSTCIVCAAGSYASGLGASASGACLACPMGTYSHVAGATTVSACLPCPAGTFATRAGLSNQSLCLTCAPGTYSVATAATSSAMCQRCSPGSYGTAAGASSAANFACFPCPAGSYSSGAGMSALASCTPCASGTYSTVVAALTSQVCLPCPVGTFGLNQSGGGSACTPCPAGTYAARNATGATSLSQGCTACVAGTFSSAVAAVSPGTCLNCSLGRYSTGVGVSNGTAACLPCRAGTYNPITGASSIGACLLCPAGTASVVVGAAALAACSLCSPGFTFSAMGSTFCDTCFSGTRLVAATLV